MKTHFTNIEYGNESSGKDDWYITACGLEYTESPVTDKIKYVTCKNCLNKLNNQKEENK